MKGNGDRNMNAKLLCVVCLLVSVVAGMPMPSEYGYNECELIATDFQEEHGGSLVFVQPLKENGAYDLSEYGGHFLNAVYISGNRQVFYFDWGNQKIFSTLEDAEAWYEGVYGRQVEIWNLAEEQPPFRIIYHYGDGFK